MTAKPLHLLDELRRWCPGVVEGVATSATQPPLLLDAETYCRQLATSHYENFSLVGCLLPSELRQPFFNVYAYCRWSDDLGDELGDRELSTRLLGWWRGELARCWAGEEMRHPVFVALQDTLQEFALSREPFDNLLTAFEQDQRVTEYHTFGELLGYCRNSANPVGRIVLRLCRCDDERSVELSDSVCTGLQLANFWQDVARDADIGRTYLPLEDCERFGYSRQDLTSRVTNEAFVALLRFEVDRTRELLLSVRELAPRLHGRLQVAIELFGEGGMTICDRIESLGYRIWDMRPVVTKWDASRLLLKCLGRALVRQCLGSRAVSISERTNINGPLSRAELEFRGEGESLTRTEAISPLSLTLSPDAGEREQSKMGEVAE